MNSEPLKNVTKHAPPSLFSPSLCYHMRTKPMGRPENPPENEANGQEGKGGHRNLQPLFSWPVSPIQEALPLTQ